MRSKTKHIILALWVAFSSTSLYAQLSVQDSITLEKRLKGDKPIILNQEVIKSIKFEGSLLEHTPEGMMKPASHLTPDLTLPEVLIDKDGQLTLRPYTIYLKPYEDPIQGLPPHILMNTDIGPGGSSPTPSFGIGIVLVFDAEAILRRIFWKSERAKRKNAKRVQAHKFY